MLDKAMEALGDFGDDELGTPDWSTMKKYITCLSSLEGRKLRPHNELETSNYQTKTTLSDMRVRLLNGNSVICLGYSNSLMGDYIF